MLYNLNDPNIKGEMGKEMGSGISQALQTLLSMKLQDIEKRKQAETLQSLGLPKGAENLDPRIVNTLLQGLQERGFVQNQIQPQAPGSEVGMDGGQPQGELNQLANIMSAPNNIS